MIDWIYNWRSGNLAVNAVLSHLTFSMLQSVFGGFVTAYFFFQIVLWLTRKIYVRYNPTDHWVRAFKNPLIVFAVVYALHKLYKSGKCQKLFQRFEKKRSKRTSTYGYYKDNKWVEMTKDEYDFKYGDKKRRQWNDMMDTADEYWEPGNEMWKGKKQVKGHLTQCFDEVLDLLGPVSLLLGCARDFEMCKRIIGNFVDVASKSTGLNDLCIGAANIVHQQEQSFGSSSFVSYMSSFNERYLARHGRGRWDGLRTLWGVTTWVNVHRVIACKVSIGLGVALAFLYAKWPKKKAANKNQKKESLLVHISEKDVVAQVCDDCGEIEPVDGVVPVSKDGIVIYCDYCGCRVPCPLSQACKWKESKTKFESMQTGSKPLSGATKALACTMLVENDDDKATAFKTGNYLCTAGHCLMEKDGVKGVTILKDKIHFWCPLIREFPVGNGCPDTVAFCQLPVNMSGLKSLTAAPAPNDGWGYVVARVYGTDAIEPSFGSFETPHHWCSTSEGSSGGPFLTEQGVVIGVHGIGSCDSNKFYPFTKEMVDFSKAGSGTTVVKSDGLTAVLSPVIPTGTPLPARGGREVSSSHSDKNEWHPLDRTR
jgi:hypothetical protein